MAYDQFAFNLYNIFLAVNDDLYLASMTSTVRKTKQLNYVAVKYNT